MSEGEREGDWQNQRAFFRRVREAVEAELDRRLETGTLAELIDMRDAGIGGATAVAGDKWTELPTPPSLC